MRTAWTIIKLTIIGLVVCGMTAWACLAIYYSDLPGETLRLTLAVGLVICTIGSFVLIKNRVRTLIGFLILFCLIVAWWLTIEPSNDRHWQKDVAVLPYATIQGNFITIHNIRNINYRTDTDFDVTYYDKTFDLDMLGSVDLIAVYWMGDAIAHIMISFGFQGKDYIDFSIETRKEIGEGYSTIKGFFKQYENIYIAGDERDLIRVRTDFRKPQEDVYIFRTKTPPERARKLFMEYVREINKLTERPQWYNTLTTNCTTNVLKHVRTYNDEIKYTWKILLSGYTPQYIYELGGLDTRLPFEELKKVSYINSKAHEVGNDPEFSTKIREDIPCLSYGRSGYGLYTFLSGGH